MIRRLCRPVHSLALRASNYSGAFVAHLKSPIRRAKSAIPSHDFRYDRSIPNQFRPTLSAVSIHVQLKNFGGLRSVFCHGILVIDRVTGER